MTAAEMIANVESKLEQAVVAERARIATRDQVTGRAAIAALDALEGSIRATLEASMTWTPAEIAALEARFAAVMDHQLVAAMAHRL